MYKITRKIKSLAALIATKNKSWASSLIRLRAKYTFWYFVILIFIAYWYLKITIDLVDLGYELLFENTLKYSTAHVIGAISFYLFGSFFVVSEFLKSLFKLIHKEKKYSVYFSIAIVLMIVILFFGFGLLSKTFKSSYPLSVEFHEDQYKADITCSGINFDDAPVLGDHLDCKGKIVAKNPNAFAYRPVLKDFRDYYHLQTYLPPKHAFTNDMLLRADKLNNYTISLTGGRIPINVSGSIEVFIKLEFTDADNNSTGLSPSHQLKFQAISPQDYAERVNKRLTFTYLLISLSFFSVFSGVYHLKKIVE